MSADLDRFLRNELILFATFAMMKGGVPHLQLITIDSGAFGSVFERWLGVA
jgi:hypothetical protein